MNAMKPYDRERSCCTHVGDRVRIERGPWAGESGIVESFPGNYSAKIRRDGDFRFVPSVEVSVFAKGRKENAK
jgi:transcription antitermination factor NusG